MEIQMKNSATLSNYPTAPEVSDLIFQRVYENNGKIESFCWQNGICSFSFRNCRPEEIVFDSPCSVSCSPRTRLFAASFQVKSETPGFCDAAFPQNEFAFMLKNSLESSGAKVHFEFSDKNLQKTKFFTNRFSFRATLKACERCENLSFWHLQELSIIQKNAGFFITAAFSKGIVASSSLLPLFCSYSELFHLQDDLYQFPRNSSEQDSFSPFTETISKSLVRRYKIQEPI